MAINIQALEMSADTHRPTTAARSVVVALLPIMAAVFVAFLDLALGLANPALGLVAGWFGLGSVFVAGALVVTCSAVVAVRLPKGRFR